MVYLGEFVMKKIIVLVLILLCLCSCSGKEKTEEGETASFGKIIGTVGWVVPPSINATGVGILETEHAAGFPYHLERVGHPQEWDYTAGIGPYYVSENEYVGAPKYTPDSAVVYTEGDNMIFDYDGNLLNPSYNGYWYVQNGGFCSGDYACRDVLFRIHRRFHGDRLPSGHRRSVRRCIEYH